MALKVQRKADDSKIPSLGGFGAAQIIARMMQAMNLTTQSALAEELGVSRGAVSDAKAKDKIPAEWMLKLFRGHGLNPFWMETGRGAMYLDQGTVREDLPAGPGRGEEGFDFIPLVEAKLSGGGGSLETEDRVLGYYAFRRAWLNGRGKVDAMRLMRVTGQSMEPTLEDEDVVLVDLSQQDILAGKIYAVRMDDEIVVKRLEKKPGLLVLVSDNRRFYDPLEVVVGEQLNVQVVGRVIWMAREMM
ncbi:MAG: helix-turn-helix transcriptional regulator [Proteobacteria bacterium]|nr:helix-turn-helix transcriptional regulator [Pseudomonadota bacterium]